MHIHPVTLVTNTMFWTILAMLAVYEWIQVTDSYPMYASCTDLGEDYPLGIAAEWAPRIGPLLVLNEVGNRWEQHNVSAVDNDLYVRQHYWLDGDSDGIMCERLEGVPSN